MNTQLTSYDKHVEAVLKHKYELKGLIGKGGMANVYRGIQKGLERDVALKIIHPQFLNDEDLMARFRLEAKSAANLNHPNIVTIYDALEVDDVVLMAMEYLEGMDLAAKIKKDGKLTSADTAELMIPVAEALAYIHQKGVIHRDIKSSNIFLNGSRPMLTDFGIATLKEMREKLTLPGTVIGTPEYMSPEQANGKDIDHRSDIYSLGVVMYQCVAGTVPFKGDTPMSTIIKINQDRPPELNPHHTDARPWLKSIIFKCLEKNPADRFADALELYKALKQGIADPESLTLQNKDDKTIVLNRYEASETQSQVEKVQALLKRYHGTEEKSAKTRLLKEIEENHPDLQDLVQLEKERLQIISKAPSNFIEEEAKVCDYLISEMEKFKKLPTKYCENFIVAYEKLQPLQLQQIKEPSPVNKVYQQAKVAQNLNNGLKEMEDALTSSKPDMHFYQNVGKLLINLILNYKSLEIIDKEAENEISKAFKARVQEAESQYATKALTYINSMAEDKPTAQSLNLSWELGAFLKKAQSLVPKNFVKFKELSKQTDALLTSVLPQKIDLPDTNPKHTALKDRASSASKKHSQQQVSDHSSALFEEAVDYLRESFDKIVYNTHYQKLIRDAHSILSKEGTLRVSYKLFSPKVPNQVFQLISEQIEENIVFVKNMITKAKFDATPHEHYFIRNLNMLHKKEMNTLPDINLKSKEGPLQWDSLLKEFLVSTKNISSKKYGDFNELNKSIMEKLRPVFLYTVLKTAFKQ